MYNKEHYRDPTAYKAMANAETSRAKEAVKNIRRYLAENDFELLNRLVIKDKRTGKIIK